MTLRLATGPVSFGVDFADAPGNPPWSEVVAGIDAAGYRWTELGPLGYLPPDELARRGIGVTGGFVFEPLLDGDRALAAARRDGDFWASVRAGVFRPLGEGVVDLPGLIAALAEHAFDGWAVVEQDRVPGGDPVADLVAARRAVEALL